MLIISCNFVREVDSSSDRDYLFFTNNASKVPSVYVEKLGKMGLEITEDKVVTAGDVCAEFLTENYPGARIYLNGTPLLYENWKEKGLKLVEDDPDVAVQSFDTTMTYEKMDRICDFVRGGVPFIATHMDINCPTEDGFMPDCGAMCSLIPENELSRKADMSSSSRLSTARVTRFPARSIPRGWTTS